jgi:hypothetical protein
VLYLARADEPEHHRGRVLRLEGSVFAPEAPLVPDATTFRVRYIAQLRGLWRRDPAVFLRLIAQATGRNDLTLVDGWGDAPHAPRRMLATALKQIARTQADAAHRKPRDRAHRGAAGEALR